jgi:hypothetical protein
MLGETANRGRRIDGAVFPILSMEGETTLAKQKLWK